MDKGKAAVAAGVMAVMVMASIGRVLAEGPPTPRVTRMPTALPGGNMLPTWMTPPAPGPTQADAGAALYYARRMACHGDRGQGLTVEWRAQWDVAHQDCARSTCHGPRHPPEGFSFPKNFAPPLTGAGSLERYADAGALYEFISKRMPYQAPGSLEADEYWALVAYLLRERGLNVARVDATNAGTIALHHPAVTLGGDVPIAMQVLAGSGAVMAGIVGGFALKRLRARG